MTAKTSNLSNLLGAYLTERAEQEEGFRYASLELENLLFAAFGLIWDSGNEEEPFDWSWIGEWVKVFSSKEAFGWIKAGIFDTEEAYQMNQEGQSPGDRVRGDRRKEVARQFSDWLKANHQREKQEREKTSMSCISCGSSCEENVAYLDEKGVCPICKLERAVSSFIREELGEAEEKELIEMLDLPCSRWVGNGFSPEEAMVRIKAGVFDPDNARS